MSKRNLVRGIVVVLFCSLGGYAFSLKLDNASLRERLSELAVGTSAVSEIELTSSSSQLEEGAAQVKTDAETKESVVAGVETGPSEAELRSEQRREERRERMGRFIASFDDPVERMVFLDRELGEIDQRYSRFFKSLDLTEDEIEELKTVMAERNVLSLEERMKGRFYEDEDEILMMKADIDERRSNLGDALTDLIGEEGRDAMTTFRREEPYRERVDTLENSLSYTSSPISENQRTALVSAYAEVGESFQYSKDLSDRRSLRGQDVSEEDVNTFLGEMDVINGSLLVKASEVLNEDQLANLAEQQLSERMQVERRLSFQREGGGGRGGRGGGGR